MSSYQQYMIEHLFLSNGHAEVPPERAAAQDAEAYCGRRRWATAVTRPLGLRVEPGAMGIAPGTLVLMGYLAVIHGVLHWRGTWRHYLAGWVCDSCGPRWERYE